jgi:HK97 gp10 family phage protein
MLTVDPQIAPDFYPNVQRASRRVESAISSALSIAAMEIANAARQRAPYKTGTLRRSIQVIERGPLDIAVASNLPYAARIEYGFARRDSLGRLYNQPARPYLRPAIEETRGRAWQIFQEELRRELGG